MNTVRISIKEKFSYGLGDTGCNLVWQTVMLFMARFYTDVFGLSPAHMGTMFLAVRVLDAVTDVLMGRWRIVPGLNMGNSVPIFYGSRFLLAYFAA